MKDFVTYSVVVPVYQGEATVEELFAQIRAFFEDKQDSFEVIFVSDGAKDRSWIKIKNLKKKYPEYIQGIQLSRNFGQHNATICGIVFANGDFIITMDEDLQHAPREIEKLLKKQKLTNLDVVYGTYAKPKHGLFRNLSSLFLRKILNVALPDLFPQYSSFRLIKANIAKATLDMNHPYPFLDAYLSWLTTYVGNTQVEHYKRVEGVSSYDLQKLLRHSIHIIFNFSNLPIRLFSYLSFLLFFLSTGYALFVLMRKIIYDDLITGFATIAIFLGMGFGMVFLGIGLLGEYIQHINLKTTQKPKYLVKEKI